MPRRERPLDPSEGPVESFAADLRRLREEAGRPSYRELERKTHYSKATLSHAASGHRLPTLAVTLAYVEACGGDPAEWRARWEDVRRQLGLPTSENTSAANPSVAEDVSAGAPAGPARSVSARRFATALAAGITALLVVAAATIWRSRLPAPATRATTIPTVSTTSPAARFVGGRQDVRDDADPLQAGCASDPGLTTLDSVQVHTADQHLLGVLDLRHSPRCRAAWGRFSPSERLTYFRGARIRVIVRRPATETSGRFYETSFDGQDVYGNILLEQQGCVEAVVTVTGPAGVGSGTTACKP